MTTRSKKTRSQQRHQTIRNGRKLRLQGLEKRELMTATIFGDFNDDGFDDLVRGNPAANNGAGEVRIVYGSKEGPGAFDQVLTQDSPGIPGVAEKGDAFGTSLAVGDFNRDGVDDLAVGVPKEDVGRVVDAGAVNIIFGKRGEGLSTKGQIWDQNSSGIKDRAEKYDQFGKDIAAGDFNGDRYDDLAIGISGEDVGRLKNAGAVQVIYGGRGGLTKSDQIWHQDVSGIKGKAEKYDYFGDAVAVGDFNNDGRDDLAIGVLSEDVGKLRNAGAVNVIYGTKRGLRSSGNQIFDQNDKRLPGRAEADDRFGQALTTGDFNGDGRDDLVIGVPGEDHGKTKNGGVVHVLYGTSKGVRTSGSQYYHQNSSSIADKVEAHDAFGSALAAGDFNGDRRDDLVIGVAGEDLGRLKDAGVVQVIYGSSKKLTKTDQYWHQNVRGVHGVSEKYDYYGRSVATGDINGDGRADLASHSPGEDTHGVKNLGAVNLQFGNRRGLRGDVIVQTSKAQLAREAQQEVVAEFRKTFKKLSQAEKNGVRKGFADAAAKDTTSFSLFGDAGKAVSDVWKSVYKEGSRIASNLGPSLRNLGRVIVTSAIEFPKELGEHLTDFTSRLQKAKSPKDVGKALWIFTRDVATSPVTNIFDGINDVQSEINALLFGRELTSKEKAFAYKIFGNQIDLTDTMVLPNTVKAGFEDGQGMVGGNVIWHSGNPLGGVHARALFAHELTHIYQDQNIWKQGTIQATREFFSSTTRNPYVVQVRHNLDWSQLGSEQQAVVVQYYQYHLENYTVSQDRFPGVTDSEAVKYITRVLKQAKLFGLS